MKAKFVDKFFTSNITAQRLLILLFIIVQASLLIGHLFYQRHYIADNAGRILRNTAILEKEHFETTLEAMRYQVRVIGNAFLLDHTVTAEKAEPFLGKELQRKWLNAVVVFDAKGDFVANQSIFPLKLALDDSILKQASFRDRPLFKALRQEDESERFFYWQSNGSDPNLVGFVLYRAVRDPGGKYLGGVVGFFSADSLESMFRRMERDGFDLGPNGAMAVFDRDSTAQLARMGAGSDAGASRYDARLKELLGFVSETAQVHDYESPMDDIPRTGVFLNLNVRKWILAVGLAKKDIFHGWYVQAFWTVLAIIALSVTQWLLVHYIRINYLQRERLAIEARHDPLTGLANRRQFDEWAKAVCSTARRHQQPLCVMALDLDFFKKINDNYGHEGGDAVLKYVGVVLPGLIRGGDIAARFGGEEFIIGLPFTELTTAVEIAERIRTTFETHGVPYNGEMIHFTSSFGVAQITADELEVNDGMQTLLSRADQALYRAKQDGRNCVRVDEGEGGEFQATKNLFM